jgi:hypothetical protein
MCKPGSESLLETDAAGILILGSSVYRDRNSAPYFCGGCEQRYLITLTTFPYNVLHLVLGAHPSSLSQFSETSSQVSLLICLFSAISLLWTVLKAKSMS